MARPRPARPAALAAAALLALLGTAATTGPPAHAEDTASVVLSDEEYRPRPDGKFVRVRFEDRVTYPVAGGRGRVVGWARAEANGGAPASPTTLSSYYTVRRVADAGWQGTIRVTSSDSGAFSVGGLTAYRSGRSPATSPDVGIGADLTAFLPVGAEVEHSATATFTPAAGVRITLTAWDRHPLY